jgi:hypothetical protein
MLRRVCEQVCCALLRFIGDSSLPGGIVTRSHWQRMVGEGGNDANKASL